MRDILKMLLVGQISKLNLPDFFPAIQNLCEYVQILNLIRNCLIATSMSNILQTKKQLWKIYPSSIRIRYHFVKKFKHQFNSKSFHFYHQKNVFSLIVVGFVSIPFSLISSAFSVSNYVKKLLDHFSGLGIPSWDHEIN